MSQNAPNILLIMSDEHDAAVTGCYGDPVVRTPHLDALADSGVTFDACYCNSPLCVPSRLSYTACQYISRCGAWSNSQRLPDDDYPSLPRVLRRAGVTPYLCGKQHYAPDRRYGFVDLIPDLPTNHCKKNGKSEHRHPDAIKPADANRKSWSNRSRDFHPGDHSNVLNHDRAVNAAAIDFLTKRKAADGPFFLHVGHLAPHFPLIVPQRYVDYYRGKVPMPKIPARLLENQPLNYQHLRSGFGLIDIPDDLVRNGRELYWALIDWYDDLVGQLLVALRQSDVAGNTIVIYTSDHGENKGDHGLWWKNNCYDHGARVPLIISDPRHESRWQGGQRRTQVCSLVDLVQTVIALQGGEPDPQMDGDCMLSLMDDPASPWKDCALSQYFGHNIMSGMTMFRQGRFKYIYHAKVEGGGGERELYDMLADPDELNNLANAPQHQHTVANLHAAMLRETGENPDVTEARCRADLAIGYPDMCQAEA